MNMQTTDTTQLLVCRSFLEAWLPVLGSRESSVPGGHVGHKMEAGDHLASLGPKEAEVMEKQVVAIAHSEPAGPSCRGLFLGTTGIDGSQHLRHLRVTESHISPPLLLQVRTQMYEEVREPPS